MNTNLQQSKLLHPRPALSRINTDPQRANLHPQPVPSHPEEARMYTNLQRKSPRILGPHRHTRRQSA